MQNEICNALRKLAQEYDCRILFAAESGSRAWGFASPDSDYDIRAIYVKPRDWYLMIEETPKDTIEAMLPNDLDISCVYFGPNSPMYEPPVSPQACFQAAQI